MALPALTADMPSVLVLGHRGYNRELVVGTLKTCAEILKPRIGEPIGAFKVADVPGQEPRELTSEEIKRVARAFG